MNEFEYKWYSIIKKSIVSFLFYKNWNTEIQNDISIQEIRITSRNL